MCSTCGCKDAETLEAPMTIYDEYCLVCPEDSTASSNLCMKCQKVFGVKKASNRMIARLGLSAESFEAYAHQGLTKLYGISGGVKIQSTVQRIIADINEGQGFADDEYYYLTEDERDEAYEEMEFDAESFEAEEWRERFFKNPQVLTVGGKDIALIDEYTTKDGGFRGIEIMYPIEGGSRTDGWYGPSTNIMFKNEKLDYIEMPRGDRAYFDDMKITKFAESFEAQRKLTDIDRDGKPYTGQIYPDHPDLDSTKADRNKDGYMSSWERALGNQVARGMEKYKSERKKPMKRMSMRKTSRKSTSILPSVVVVGLIAAVVGIKIRK